MSILCLTFSLFLLPFPCSPYLYGFSLFDSSLLKEMRIFWPTICRCMLGRGQGHVPVWLKCSHYPRFGEWWWLAAKAPSHNSHFLFSLMPWRQSISSLQLFCMVSHLVLLPLIFTSKWSPEPPVAPASCCSECLWVCTSGCPRFPVAGSWRSAISTSSLHILTN